MSLLHFRKPNPFESCKELGKYEHYITKEKEQDGIKIPFNVRASQAEQLKELKTRLIGLPSTPDGGYIPQPSYLDPLRASDVAENYAQSIESLITPQND